MGGGEASGAARAFLTGEAPARLARDPGLGAEVRGRCRIDVREEDGTTSTWTVDTTTAPPVVVPGGATSDCHMTLAAGDLVQMIEDPAAGQVLSWQGRVAFGGDQALLRRVSVALFPPAPGEDGAFAGYYAALARLVPDRRLTFMNHGYAGDDVVLSDLDDAERPWAHAVALVRRTLDDAPLAGARVLDVGCGRGGPAAYVARHHAPREVVGLDACADAIALCRRHHREPNLSFVHGRADDLPFPDGSFDVVVNLESSHCYPDRAAFLAEVVRVLRPGGAFCYADVVRAAELPALARALAAERRLRVLREADITAGVARGIERGRTALAGLLDGARDASLANSAIIDHLVHSINVQVHRHLAEGRWRYRAWRLERVGE